MQRVWCGAPAHDKTSCYRGACIVRHGGHEDYLDVYGILAGIRVCRCGWLDNGMEVKHIEVEAFVIAAKRRGRKPMMSLFQLKVMHWMLECFGAKIANDKAERNFRFLEESLELVQAGGMTKEQCLALVDYTYSRPVGEMGQEVGGVCVTLAALCNANHIEINEEFDKELTRILHPEVMVKIRAKQAAKPKNIANSPLP
jgi:hypothetical protein